VILGQISSLESDQQNVELLPVKFGDQIRSVTTAIKEHT